MNTSQSGSACLPLLDPNPQSVTPPLINHIVECCFIEYELALTQVVEQKNLYSTGKHIFPVVTPGQQPDNSGGSI